MVLRRAYLDIRAETPDGSSPTCTLKLRCILALAGLPPSLGLKDADPDNAEIGAGNGWPRFARCGDFMGIERRREFGRSQLRTI